MASPKFSATTGESPELVTAETAHTETAMSTETVAGGEIGE